MPEETVLPSWFVLDPATVIKDSLIRGDQQSTLGGEVELTARIQRLTPELGAFVLGRLQTKAVEFNLIADFSDDLSTVLTLTQKVQAIGAGRMLVIAALHGVMPSEKNQSAAKALQDGRGEAVIGMSRLGSALSYIESLEAQLTVLAARRAGGGAQSIQVMRVDEDDRRVEYEPWRRCRG